jgi:hypothetical protein
LILYFTICYLCSIRLRTEGTMKHEHSIYQSINVSLYADIKNNKFIKPAIEIKKSLAKTHLELVEEMFKTYSLAGFHIKGGIKKALDSDNAKLKRELFKKAGLIK